MTRSQKLALVTGGLLALLLVIGALVILVFTKRSAAKIAVTSAQPEKVLNPLRFELLNRVQIADDPQLRFRQEPFTISFWFRTTSTRKYTAMVAKRTSALGDGWVLGTGDNDGLYFYCAGCASPTSQGVQFRDGKWHHYVLTREGETLTFYFDNRNVGGGPTRCDHNDGNPLKIGMDADQGWHFEGEVAEVHFYNRTLSGSEIAEEWNNGKGRKTAVSGGGLVAGYHFDERGGAIAKDFSGNGHDGTLIKAPESAATRSN